MTWLVSLGLYTVVSYCCIGRGGSYCGRTASGAPVGPGTVAADTRLLPFGSRLYVPEYGMAVVRDTGGAVKGRVLDVWFYDCADAWRWGRRSLEIRRVVWVPLPDPPEPEAADETNEGTDVDGG